MTLEEALNKSILMAQLRSTEHDFIERKPNRQPGEWLQAAVAFANSAPVGYPAILFVGADDHGNPQCEVNKLEDLQKSVTDTLDKAFPPIYRFIVPLTIGERGCVAVVIPGSAHRPHFAGQAYIREGPQTKLASRAQFDLLISQRQSKVYEILKWKNKPVSYRRFNRDNRGVDVPGPQDEANVDDCTAYYLIFSKLPRGIEPAWPLDRIDLSWDVPNNRLLLELRDH